MAKKISLTAEQRQDQLVLLAKAAIEARPENIASILHDLYQRAWGDYEKFFMTDSKHVGGVEIRYCERRLHEGGVETPWG